MENPQNFSLPTNQSQIPTQNNQNSTPPPIQTPQSLAQGIYYSPDIANRINENRKNSWIPQSLKFPIVWTLFFLIIGIILQSISEKRFVFLEFFG